MISLSQKVRFIIISSVSVSVIITLIWYNMGISSHLQDFKDRSNNLDRQLQVGASLPDNINSAISSYKARKAELESYKVPVAESDDIIKLLVEKPDDSWLKSDIQDWLRVRNTSFIDSETKSELLGKI